MSSKLKLLRVYDLLKETDINHPLTVNQIVSQLSKFNIDAERKSVMRDVAILREFGVEICVSQDNKKGYYIQNATFANWELKLIGDIMDHTRFISTPNVQRFFEKVRDLATVNQNKLFGTGKLVLSKHHYGTAVEQTINILQQAIQLNKQVSFQYLDLNEKLEPRPRKNKRYIVNPFQTLMRYDEYYLIANTDPYENLNYYKISKMANVIMLDQDSKVLESIFPVNAELELRKYVEKTIYGFQGASITIAVETYQNYIDRLIDSFGEQVRIEALDDDRIKAYIKTVDSDGLYYWLLQHMPYLKVISPMFVVDRMLELLNEGLNSYAKIRDKTEGEI